MENEFSDLVDSDESNDEIGAVPRKKFKLLASPKKDSSPKKKMTPAPEVGGEESTSGAPETCLIRHCNFDSEIPKMWRRVCASLSPTE
jgi:hypothetical protein